MAPGNLTTTTTGQAIIKFALSAIGATDIDFLDIGDDTVTAADFAARYLTRAEKDIYQRHPSLGMARDAAVSVAADSDEITLPAGVWGIQVDKLRFSDSSSAFDGMPIPIVSREEGENRIGETDVTATISPFAYWNYNKTKLLLAYKVPSAQTYILTYRARPTVYLTATVASQISTIPDDYNETVMLRLAEIFARRMRRFDLAAQLREEFEEADAILADALINNNEQLNNLFWSDAGSPQSPLVGFGQMQLTPY